LTAYSRQVDGDHYQKLAIQPMQYSLLNGLDAAQHTVIKYVTQSGIRAASVTWKRPSIALTC
jgi:hypothetical protein